MVHSTISTLLTITLVVHTSPRLRTDTNAIAHLHALDIFAHFHGAADNLVADDAGVVCLAPSGAEGVDVGAADAAVGDFDVDVGFFPFLGLVGLPLHVSVDGFGVETHPAFEFVVGGHF